MTALTPIHHLVEWVNSKLLAAHAATNRGLLTESGLSCDALLQALSSFLVARSFVIV